MPPFSRTAAAAVAVLTATALAAASPGTARAGHSEPATPTVLADGLVTPLKTAVTEKGTAYVTQNFAGQLLRIRRGAAPEVVYADSAGREVGAVSVQSKWKRGHHHGGKRHHTSVVFTLTEGGPAGITGSLLMRLKRDGAAAQIADLLAYETAANPDQHTRYGFRHIDPDCAARWPAENGEVSYTGHVDSHAYSTTQVGKWIFVGDAGANAVFAVSRHGHVKTVAVLPAIPFRITAEAATALGLHECFIGKKYWFESVPTDVEMGRHGQLFVTSLPGGPEGPELGARGSVFKIDLTAHHRSHHRVKQIARGFSGATGLALGPDRAMYVAEMFGNKITRVSFKGHHAKSRTFATPTTPGDVESARGKLYATIDVLSGPSEEDPTAAPAGQLVKYRVHH